MIETASPVQDWLDGTFGQALLQRIAGLTGKRILVAIAGAPGSGKSTLAAELVKRLPGAALVPMDGFHLDDLLLAERGLLARKGAVETFDADGFAALVARLAQPDCEVIYPIFDRSREIAIAGSGVVSADQRIVVIEGNYLLLDLHPWNEIHYDLTICLDVPEAELQRRLTERWLGFGKKPEAVRAHLENDLANAHRVIVQSMEADIVIEATI